MPLPLTLDMRTMQGIHSKLKRCSYCKAMFVPARPMQSVCDWSCGHALIQKRKAGLDAKKAKAERAEIRARKEKAKRSKTLRAEAQSAINAYRRTSDILAGYGCICCDKPFEPQRPGGSVDAGHYLSRGSHPHLAFVEMNINAQRKSCNRPGGTTAAAFRLGMIKRYGLPAVEALESDMEPRRYRDDDYRAIRDEYKAKLKKLKRGNNG